MGTDVLGCIGPCQKAYVFSTKVWTPNNRESGNECHVGTRVKTFEECKTAGEVLTDEFDEIARNPPQQVSQSYMPSYCSIHNGDWTTHFNSKWTGLNEKDDRFAKHKLVCAVGPKVKYVFSRTRDKCSAGAPVESPEECSK